MREQVVDFGSIHVARFCSALVAADVSPEGASVRPAKGEALVQRPHQNPFLFPVTSGPTGQEFIFNPTRTVRQTIRRTLGPLGRTPQDTAEYNTRCGRYTRASPFAG